MKITRIAVIALLAVFMISGGAIAATDIYKDTYTTEDSSGNWTFTGNMSVSGNTTLTGTVTGKEPTTVLTNVTASTIGNCYCGKVRLYVYINCCWWFGR